MSHLTDNDLWRRDRLDLDGLSSRDACCQHCRLNWRELGPSGSYLDLYVRSGLPTKAIGFAAICWGLGELIGAARYLWLWGIEVYQQYGGAVVGPRGWGGLT